jgi:glycosyltransferase involved in cell wall biosynthesis
MLIVAPHDRFLSSVDLSGVDVQFITWQAEREIEHLHLMDIGLMPLPDGQLWMRYKAATKLIQYLAVGIPAIASPIGVNADILDNSRVGLAATTTDQWVNALTKLLNDGALRRRMGQQGRELVTSRFSIEANAPRLEEILTTRSP